MATCGGGAHEAANEGEIEGEGGVLTVLAQRREDDGKAAAGSSGRRGNGNMAAFRERELADSGRKNLGKETGGLGSEEEARHRGKWRPEAARIGRAHLGRREAVSRDGSRGGRGGRAAHGGCGAGEGDDAARCGHERRRGVAGGGDGGGGSGARCGGGSGRDTGRGGADAEVWLGVAETMVAVAWLGGDPSGGGVRPEVDGERRRLCSRGENGRVRGKAGRGGETREHGRGMLFMGARVWNRGRVRRNRPTTWGGDVQHEGFKPTPTFWTKVGQEVEK
uniref:Uncharacterized protein n=1 Tax=Oryza sativa subsp. japonica TaxID=39947 RepID=Q2QRG2_ORYSJ|nr:hypothetical protein LOC_Os12g27670 [Oryza sativa Japonica Group]